MMEINYDVDLLNRLAARFQEMHHKQNLDKARNLSSFLQKWAVHARSTGPQNVRDNLLPAAIQQLSDIYPRYRSDIACILTTILIEENVDWNEITDELYRLVSDYSVKPQRPTNFVSAT